MREGTEWQCMLAVTDARQRLIGGDDPPIRDVEDRWAATPLFVGSATEPSPGASTPAFKQEFFRFPSAEDGVFIVDADTGRVLETLPLAGQGRGKRINCDVVPNSDSPGQVEMLYSHVCDITPHARLLRRARTRVKGLATANRRKDEFLATLGHELRCPLASIQNAVHLLSAQTGETPARQGAQALIERQVRRMTRLVDDLLDVSRISQGRLRLRRERIDLRLVVSNAIETLQSDIKERNHTLAVELPDAPVWLQADPWRLEQVFVNLLANASKYTDAGGELAAWMHTRDGQVVVRIRDSGIGIAPEALPHIFDLFRQTDEAAARSRSGLGIGLALVRNLVESHGGSVTAGSAGLGKGSEFTVRLPRSGEAAAAGDHIPF
jgi:signal transduction histidine kinase